MHPAIHLINSQIHEEYVEYNRNVSSRMKLIADFAIGKTRDPAHHFERLTRSANVPLHVLDTIEEAQVTMYFWNGAEHLYDLSYFLMDLPKLAGLHLRLFLGADEWDYRINGKDRVGHSASPISSMTSTRWTRYSAPEKWCGFSLRFLSCMKMLLTVEKFFIWKRVFQDKPGQKLACEFVGAEGGPYTYCGLDIDYIYFDQSLTFEDLAKVATEKVAAEKAAAEKLAYEKKTSTTRRL